MTRLSTWAQTHQAQAAALALGAVLAVIAGRHHASSNGVPAGAAGMDTANATLARAAETDAASQNWIRAIQAAVSLQARAAQLTPPAVAPRPMSGAVDGSGRIVGTWSDRQGNTL